MIRYPSKTILEYIWIGGKNEIRSKTRVINNRHPIVEPGHIPEWNYDGSSTWQADSNGDTEIILKPCAIYKDPTRIISDGNALLVLCDTYDINGNPTKTNQRHAANKIFEQGVDFGFDSWFGLEQEYFIILPDDLKNTHHENGLHYCGTIDNYIERDIAEQHLRLCIEAGINISGINSEVAKYQWEFQIGPNEGITAADDLIVARYLLNLIAEQYNAKISYHPKPFKEISGSGCHINFSTFETRNENGTGIDIIYEYIKRLEKNHKESIKAYGDDNHLRLTGFHETSSYDNFTYDIGTRNTSVRIPNHVVREKNGYFEDRRPAANIDPYLATSSLFKICCINSDY
jgi:glutamine synthetase